MSVIMEGIKFYVECLEITPVIAGCPKLPEVTLGVTNINKYLLKVQDKWSNMEFRVLFTK